MFVWSIFLAIDRSPTSPSTGWLLSGLQIINYYFTYAAYRSVVQLFELIIILYLFAGFSLKYVALLYPGARAEY